MTLWYLRSMADHDTHRGAVGPNVPGVSGCSEVFAALRTTLRDTASADPLPGGDPP